MPGAALRIVVPGPLGGGGHGGPSLAVLTEPSIQLAANARGIVKVERHRQVNGLRPSGHTVANREAAAIRGTNCWTLTVANVPTTPLEPLRA